MILSHPRWLKNTPVNLLLNCLPIMQCKLDNRVAIFFRQNLLLCKYEWLMYYESQMIMLSFYDIRFVISLLDFETFCIKSGFVFETRFIVTSLHL